MFRVVTSEGAFGLLAALPRCIPLSDAEIDHCEAAGGIPFTSEFRRLLRIAGGSLGWLFPNGLDHPSQVAELRRLAVELFADSGWTLGPIDIVLDFDEQGCGMLFLRADGEQSRVYRYEEAAGPEDTGLTLGLYLAGVLERHLGANA
ncbi:MAG: SMI1/KNR4 family protein [Planctomycetia bacterium]|nr:SMI1/KNR4 family protein [Planctomycetia bacterium]